jgi:pyruvate dehydrogenase E1 component alpha subunit
MKSPDIDMYQVVDPDGNAHVARSEIDLSDEDLRALYRWMVLARTLDNECMALQSEGELTVYPPFLGQEAAQVGSAFALAAAPKDMAFPSFRELAAALVRGVDPVEYLQYHRGTWHGGPYGSLATGFAPVCVTLANQLVHAAGYAMGTKLDGRDDVSLAYFGDGAASEGDFHEACNFAGVFRLPVVFFCQNNGWAISVPTERQTAAPIYLRAAGYGFPGIRVDGNDVVATWQVTRDAVARARAGEGATLIEAMTYRMGPHTTSVAASADLQDDLEEQGRLDPIARYRTWLANEGVADDAFFTECDEEAGERATAIRAGIVATGTPPAEDATRFVFENPWGAGLG